MMSVSSCPYIAAMLLSRSFSGKFSRGYWYKRVC